MAKPKIPNQKSKYKALNARLNGYALLATVALHEFVSDIVQSLSLIDVSSDAEFLFDDYPVTRWQVAEKRAGIVSRLFSMFVTWTAMEWAASNKVQDTVADKVLSAYGGNRVDKFFQDNNDKLIAFQSRVYSGNTTYGRIVEVVDTVQKEVEAAVSVSGGSPVPIVHTKVEQYFGDVSSLRQDFKKKFGHEPQVQDGQYQAQLLLRSEINMAYRTAEQERWRQMDFVVGYEIKRSATHAERVPKGDVCDLLAGKYPKFFLWTGWHPRCCCYAVPILKTEDEYVNDLPSSNEVTDVPAALYRYVADHEEQLRVKEYRGTLPYWLSYNNFASFFSKQAAG